MRCTQLVVITVGAAGLAASVCFAQGGMGGGRGAQAGGRKYDPKTVETVRGEVLSVEQVAGRGGRGGGGQYGVHLTLKTDKEEIAVHLGPSSYLERNGLKIEPKDTIEVRGSRIMFQGKPAILAAEVKKGDHVLKLRDDNGVPLWRGRGRPAGG